MQIDDPYCWICLCMQIRDGRHEWNRVIGRYCGSDETGLQPRTTGPAAIVQFHSDSSRRARGFSAVFNAKRSAPNLLQSWFCYCTVKAVSTLNVPYCSLCRLKLRLKSVSRLAVMESRHFFLRQRHWPIQRYRDIRRAKTFRIWSRRDETET